MAGVAAALARLAPAVSLALASLALAACSACEGQRQTLDFVPEVPYPIEGEGELVDERVLRSGPDMREQGVVERFEIRRAGERRIVRVEQEWALGTADVEVVYDEEWLPERVWRRTTIPDATGPIGHVDVRIYDLLGSDEGVLIARRDPTGAREGILLKGERPTAVIGPGRGLLSAWLQRARLDVGGRTREHVLDVREPLGLIREVTLQREADREMDDLGRVRVYTIYGREPVFADEEDVVVGDMMGLRRAEVVEGPVPDPMPDRAAFDPRALP